MAQLAVELACRLRPRTRSILNLAELTDDKNKFRQWDIKLANALAHFEKAYGWAMECIKECIDGGGEEEDDVRIMLALENNRGGAWA